jgi:hypothetical protein
MAGLDDIATNGTLLNQSVGRLIKAIEAIFPRINGSFTLAAAATTTVTQPAVTATSKIFLVPTNASAGTLQAGLTHLYVSARTTGASFAVTTANAGAAAGTETFDYFIINPS